MKTGVVIDSACDLPLTYIKEHDVHILPISLRFGNELFTDSRDPEMTLAFYRRYVTEKSLDAETEAYSCEQIIDFFLNDLVLRYDRVLFVTLSGTRSPLYNNALQASSTILELSKEKRRQANVEGSFELVVMDSKNLFTGQAVLLQEVLSLLERERMSFKSLQLIFQELSRHVYAYLVPRDLFYLRNRGSKKGEKTVGLVSYHLGGLLDIKPVIMMYRGDSQAVLKERGFDRALEKLFTLARQAIERGLRTKAIALSYAGDTQEIRNNAAFAEFEHYAQDRDIAVLLSIMSTTAGINVGPGAFSLAYIAEEAKDWTVAALKKAH